MTWFDEGVESALYPHVLLFHPLFLTCGYAAVTALLGTALGFISLLGELAWATKLTEKFPLCPHHLSYLQELPKWLKTMPGGVQATIQSCPKSSDSLEQC